jgi:hypothetical protein
MQRMSSAGAAEKPAAGRAIAKKKPAARKTAKAK